MKSILVYEGKLQMYAEIIATETKGNAEYILSLLTQIFEQHTGHDGHLEIYYYAEIEPFPDELVLEKALMEMHYENAVLEEEKPECPRYVEKLHPYKKHESHGKPNYWHRIRSNPRQR